MNHSFPVVVSTAIVGVANNNDTSVKNENLNQDRTDENKLTDFDSNLDTGDKIYKHEKVEEINVDSSLSSKSPVLNPATSKIPVFIPSKETSPESDVREKQDSRKQLGPVSASKVTDHQEDLSYVSGSSCPSASKIPVSTLRRGKNRKTKLPSVGSNKSSDRLFDVMADESEAMSPTNFSDGYIDLIISQSCHKSTENLLESTADDLDDSGDVFFNEEQQKSVCDSIISKFLGVATDEKVKNSDILSPVENFKSPIPAITPVMNLKTNLKLRQGEAKVQTSTPAAGTEIKDDGKNFGKVHKDLLSVTPEMYETSGGHSSNVDYLLKSFGDKSVLLESKIESLENQLNSAVASSKENAQKYDEISRKLHITETELANIEDKKGDLEVKVGAIKHDVNDKEDELRILKAKFIQLEQDYDIQNKKTDDVEEKLKECQDVIEGFEHKVKSLEGKLKLSDEENDRQEDELKRKGYMLENTLTELEGAKREVEVLKINLNNMEEKHHDLDLKFTNIVNESEDKDMKLRDLKSMVAQLQSEQKEKKDDKVVKEEKKEQDKEEFRRKRSMFENSPQPAEVVKHSCKSCEKLESKLKTVEKKLADTGLKLSAKENEVDRFKEANTALKEEEGKLDARIDELLSASKDKESILTRQEHEISSLKNKNEGLSENLNSAETKAKNTEEEVSGKMLESERLEMYVKSLKYQIKEYEEKLMKLEEQSSILKSRINTFEEESSNKDRAILQTEEALNTREMLLEETKTNLMKLEAEHEASLIKIMSLKGQASLNDEMIVKLTDLKEDNKRRIYELESKLEGVEKSMEVVLQENEKLIKEVDTLGKKHDELVNQTNTDVAEIMLL